MKRLLIYIVSLIMIFGAGVVVLAQDEDMEEEPAYISYLSGNVDVDITPENEVGDFVPAELDMDLNPGTVIRTGSDAVCEVTLPDESTIKISNGAVFKIDEVLINKKTGKKSEKFTLLFGKMKAQVKKLTTSDSQFTVASGTALAGVRGTVFGVDFDGIKSKVLVFEGKVQLGSLTGAFKPILINSGQMSIVPKGGLPEPPKPIPEDLLKEWQKEDEKFAKKAEEETQATTQPEEKKPKKPEAKGGPAKESFIEKFLKMNAYVGTVTIDNNVYSRWVFTPQLTIGKLGLGLYLPAVFSPDVGIFGFKDWENHDEWDFTSMLDGLHDFIIKFYYVSWGQKGDPLYFKIGSIDDFYLGHGFIVDNYSNMIYFPEERTVGMQFNIDGNYAGLETMVADFTRLQLFGGRLYFRPMGRRIPLALGVSAVHDRPTPDQGSWPADTTYVKSEKELPHVLFVGGDLDLPILHLKKVFTMTLYGDAASTGYIYEQVPDRLANLSDPVKPGTVNLVKGIGTAAGLMGEIASIFNYRVEYRYILDYYEPGIINGMWENRRLTYPWELEDVIYDQRSGSYENSTSAGFLIKGGMMLFQKKLEFGLGYENYKKTQDGVETPVRKGSMYVDVEKGLIPKVYGQLTYDRSDNFENIFKEPFDENTVLNADIYYELAKGIALSVNYKRTFKYNDQTDNYDPIDSFGINTNFTFF
ncbi:MAG: hypothetical protein DRP84_02305 [Spirochaetes bacterium]|nr:MAG: hypothetical protein DRP84_02305 [Spirochaetota bacterium]RKY03010.1 MAG: hypothetical protein DRP55_02045 [Spirochaetota bacterium]